MPLAGRIEAQTPAPYVPTNQSGPTGTMAVIQLCLRPELAVV